MNQHNHCFGWASRFRRLHLRCLRWPCGAKVDLAASSFKLSHWHALSNDERLQLFGVADQLSANRWGVAERAHRAMADAGPSPSRTRREVANKSEQLPDSACASSCAQLAAQFPWRLGGGWSETATFALVKTQPPWHEHRTYLGPFAVSACD